MALGEIASEITAALFRVLAEFVVEILVKGPGYIICRQFSSKVDADGPAVVLVGLLFWAIIALSGYALFVLF